jgi:hypothetical protein
MLTPMPSWRDTTSATAQSELDALLSTVLPLAREHLSRYGELLPFGAATAADGSIALLAVDTGQPSSPRVDVLQRLQTVARAGKAENRAVAFVSDVTLQAGDAVRIELEHSEGVAIVVIAPYTRGVVRRRVKIGTLRATSGEPRIWTAGRATGPTRISPTHITTDVLSRLQAG